MPRILVVEDEFKIASFICKELEHEGFQTSYADTGRKALETFENESFDLILLDIMLPELNGIEVLRRIRKTSNIPIILLTARDEVLDKVTGLDSGADDYLAKPFAIEELFARIRALLRRAKDSHVQDDIEESKDIINFKNLSMHLSRLEVTMNGDLISLTRTEFLLLQCLLDHKNHVLSREQIITEVWGPGHYIDDNSVDVYVRYIRSKIDEAYNVNYIQTVRGAGYTIKD